MAVNMKIINVSPSSIGYVNQNEAALDFYRAHENDYFATTTSQEVVGYLLYDPDEDTWHFTEGLLTDDTFNMKIGIRKPSDWVTKDIVHTHPADHTDQDGFSKGDIDAVNSGRAPGYYVRTPNGNIRYIDKSTARRSRNKHRVSGKIVGKMGAHPRN